jgi:hypothetical protein
MHEKPHGQSKENRQNTAIELREQRKWVETPGKMA